MSVRTVAPSQRLRIAIGLTALKFKPSEQSIQCPVYFAHAYLTSGSSEECDAWRDRVVALEAELQTTRAAASSEHIELLALKSAASISAQKSQVSESTTSAPKKKGKKPRRTSDAKKAQVLGVCPPSSPRSKRKTPEPCASRAFPCRLSGGVAYYMRIVAGPSSPSPRRINCGLFSSLHALDAAVSAVATTKVRSPPDTALVAAATIRCIDVLHGLLARATSPLLAPDTPLDPTPREALNGIERTLPRILRTAISTLDRADVDLASAAGLRWYADPTEGDDLAQFPTNDTTPALDLVLGRVATSLLVPAIRAIVPCTLAKTEHILSSSSSHRPTSPSSSRGREFADGADLLGLVGAGLETLSGTPDIVLHDRIALEAVRALTSLIADQPSQQQGQGSPAQRIHRIARKDALHFLCDAALLSLCRTAPAAAPPGSAAEMLGLALETALGELALTLSAREDGSGLDTVEEQRVLVVLERAWSVGRRVGNIGGEAGGDERVDACQNGGHDQDVDPTMTDVDGEDWERDDQRRGSITEPMTDGS
ncbi:hypothetical protein BJY52DRAFT_1191133 [Lactarius psammicola]|nr:hypothetical protein BJY52DRAFT_1191133 [Lactarius psammicola]